MTLDLGQRLPPVHPAANGYCFFELESEGKPDVVLGTSVSCRLLAIKRGAP